MGDLFFVKETANVTIHKFSNHGIVPDIKFKPTTPAIIPVKEWPA